MSIHLIKQYQSEVEKIIDFGGTKKETAIRTAFYNLLNEYAKQKGLMLIPEVTIKTAKGKNVIPDGTLKDTLRQDWGYWESKDEADIIDEEIKKKFDKGYPSDNILFEDSQTAVLYQSGEEVQRVKMSEAEALDRIIHSFINFERPEVRNFHKAIELFKQDIPKVTDTLRDMLLTQENSNKEFIKERDKFLKLCHESINPNVTNDDVREMMIQHILTEDIFNTIFDETQFHRENNIARELETVIHTFFTGATRKTALGTIQHYYQAINAAAAGISDHHEKQKFLKVVYEIFYKSYNPKAADRLGVVYTPNEIVKFMIESTDYLLHKHFNKFLEDKNVEILDPATGTGTFICDIIDYIRKEKLEYKYKTEIHANEVAILPYYIANLNIEYTYTQKMTGYVEFENLCFVDTIDNMGFGYKDKQINMFASFTEENTKRIKKQNERKIAVIIGNPPYNANQANENDNNKNREYPEIDKRIKDTFIKYSTAQKTKVYDMYARFYRWAFDRLDNNGIVAFITNRSFIDSRTFDGFRKCIQTDFDFAYIIDTKSDVRANPKISGTANNVFGIQTGVAIMFLVKKLKRDNTICRIHYIAMEDIWKKEEKLHWLTENPLQKIHFENIQPDKNNNWINLSENNWDEFISLENLFTLTTPGTVSNRDDWTYDFSEKNIEDKFRYECKEINNLLVQNNKSFPFTIKWSNTLKGKFLKGTKASFNKRKIIKSLFRPFSLKYYYADKYWNDRLTQNHFDIFGNEFDKQNICVSFNGVGMDKAFHIIASKYLPHLQLTPNGHCISLYHYHKNGNRLENITDWGLEQFQKNYKDKKITKENIFHYTYSVLHNPAYRKKYELNLKREFPRIPFYKDFQQWCNWGKQLMDLHINYETVKPFALKEKTDKEVTNPKCKLKTDKENGIIILDEATTLKGIPKQAWEYKLGNRSALEWILDQYKEKKPSDPTIAEKFNTYKFTDYKPQVIDLLKRVCTVSVETMRIVEEMNEKE